MALTFETFKRIFPKSARRLTRYFKASKLKRINRRRKQGY